jgi:O-methyltransferase
MVKILLPLIRIFLQTFEKILLKFNLVLIRATPYLKRKRTIDLSYRAWDYNRYSSLEFCAHEILSNKVYGNVAELGVYQGDFAAIINKLFPTKKLYLFDTFQGFDSKDISIDSEKGYKTKGHGVDFSNTSEAIVLKKMKFVENCVIMKGYFPQSLDGLEDEFCFVSIDADLYLPIYDGLCYFYPRLTKGGYLFVHDYNNYLFNGAKEAVIKFSKENGLNYFPLSDDGGTAVFVK